MKSNPKAFWRYCNTKLKNNPRLGDLKTSEGALAQKYKEKVDLLNEYFSSVYTQENLEILPLLESKYDGPPLSKSYITVDRGENKIAEAECEQSKGNRWMPPPRTEGKCCFNFTTTVSYSRSH